MELPAGDICTIFEKRGGYVLNCFTARRKKPKTRENPKLNLGYSQVPKAVASFATMAVIGCLRQAHLRGRSWFWTVFPISPEMEIGCFNTPIQHQVPLYIYMYECMWYAHIFSWSWWVWFISWILSFLLSIPHKPWFVEAMKGEWTSISSWSHWYPMKIKFFQSHRIKMPFH